MAKIHYNMNHINNDKAQCLCKKCRFDRALDKESPEDIKQKRIERAMDIVRRMVK
jgi:hypothetical protein